MRVLLYGGGFNPPHLGHLAALERARELLRPDLTLVIPDGEPPHKPFPKGSPGSDERLHLSELNFGDLSQTEISDLALRRDGPCYMIDTVTLLRRRFPADELVLLVGSDMLFSFGTWYRSAELLRECTLAALCRGQGEMDAIAAQARTLEARGGKVILLDHDPVEISSSRLRAMLPERMGTAYLKDAVYREIIRLRLYGAKPDLSWLRDQVVAMLDPKRIPHVLGCEDSARSLALRWDLDPEEAAEAGILHDMTKRWSFEEHLAYCEKMGIELDEGEKKNPQLLHARTGAVAAQELFGAPEEICDAIRWHTTGKPIMSSFEKILYLADMIEPNRSFPGVEELRSLAFEDLNLAMCHALERSVKSLRKRNMEVYKDTLDACSWYRAYGK